MSSHSPFLHFGSGDIDSGGLPATAHGKVDVQWAQPKASVTRGNDIERSRVVQDMVIQGKVTARERVSDV